MTRADALRTLIERVEAGREWSAFLVGRAMGNASIADFADAHVHRSLDAVARLEAGLRERGWWPRVRLYQEFMHHPEHYCAEWESLAYRIEGRAPTEARARLLAVLKALAWEAEHGAP